MPDKPIKIKKALPKTAKASKMPLADDTVCIPRPLYEQMVAALKGMTTNGGRAKNLLEELPLADTNK